MTLSARSLRLLALVAVASLAVGACAGGTSPSPSAAPTTPPGSEAPASEAPSIEPGTLPEPEQSSLSIGFSVTEPSQYAGVLAAQLGIYEKYGIDVEYSVFEGDARVAVALQSGQIQIGFSGSSSAISSQLTDTPYDAVAVLAVILTDDLVCQAGIDTADEVRGKTIAISTFGGTSNAAALLALQALDLGAADAVITQVGGQGARIAAVAGGSVACAVVDANLREDMLAQGFSIAAMLKEEQLPFGRSALSALEEFINANPNTMLVVVASVLEAQNEIFKDPEGMAEHYSEFSEHDIETATALLQDFSVIGNRSLTWKEEAFLNAQKAIAVVNPDIIEVELSDAYTTRFLDMLVENGFYEKIGSPVPTP